MSDVFGSSSGVKIPKFDGTNYQLFKSKLTAVCTLKGCGEALVQSFKLKLPALEATILSDATNEGNRDRYSLKSHEYFSKEYF